MPNNTLSYPKVCKSRLRKYYIDFKLNNKRYRLFGGKLIGSSLLINSYPKHLRRKQASALAEQVYRHLVANDYSFSKKLNQIETFNLLISNKLKEPLSEPYRKALSHLAFNLKEQLLSKGSISKQFLNSLPLRYENNTSYNTTRRRLNVLINYLHNNDFDIEKSTMIRPICCTFKYDESNMVALDMNKAYCSNLMDMKKFPVFNSFDKYQKYDNHKIQFR